MISPVTLLPAIKFALSLQNLDDTLTQDSRLHASTYTALERLKENGYWLVIVSGRPAGWADCLMRLWPIDAMIFENGAGVMVRDGKHLRPELLAKDQDREKQTAILNEHFQALRRKFQN